MNGTKEFMLLHGNSRLGMFIHWGLYAQTAWHEQYLMRARAKRTDYESLQTLFNPEKYDPEDWVLLAKNAGMDYICFTTKHHDGFCMWDTAQTDYSITHTPYGKDVLRMLQQACEKHGVKLALYYSIPDWHQENAYNPLSTHQIPPRSTDVPDMERYKDYVRRQITELLTGYGRICAFFWDIPPKVYDPSMNELVRTLQPGIRINNRGFDDGDFSTPERFVPEDGIFTRLTEACESVGRQSWGYRQNEDYFAPRTLCRNIDSVLSMGGNYLLNVGPMADGTIPAQSREIVQRVGQWYNRVREAYTDSKPFPYFSGREFTATCSKNDLYLHFSKGLDYTGTVLNPLTVLPESSQVLNTGEACTASLDTIPTLWQTSAEPTEYLHLTRLPAEESIGYPVIVKLRFCDLAQIENALAGTSSQQEQRL